MEVVTAVLDFLILGWLVGTWFYEGHHRRCTVVSVCPTCGGEAAAECKTHERKSK